MRSGPAAGRGQFAPPASDLEHDNKDLGMQPVKMYTTQVCPYCLRAKALLKQRGVAEIEEVRVDVDPAERDRMIELTGRRTVPQIFIGDTHVGGCDDLIALDQQGGLQALLGAGR
jgi:glutaredoxin 3